MQIRHKKSKKVNQQEIESKHIIKVSEQNKKINGIMMGDNKK